MSVPERRQLERRVPERLVYIDIKPDNGGIVLNVSDDGLCFHSVAPIYKHQPIAFSFSESSRSTDAVGEVVWIDKSRKFGGVRFNSISSEALTKIEELLRPAESDDQAAVAQLGLFSDSELQAKVIPFPDLRSGTASDIQRAHTDPLALTRLDESGPGKSPKLGLADWLSQFPMPRVDLARLRAISLDSRKGAKTATLIKEVSSRAITIALLVAAVAASISLSRQVRSSSATTSQPPAVVEATTPDSFAPTARREPVLKRVSLSPAIGAPVRATGRANPSPEIIVSKPARRTESGVSVRDTVISFKTPSLPPPPVVNAVPVSFHYPVVSNPSLSGSVKLKLLIDTKGSVRSVTVVSGKGPLARASSSAVRAWRYHPVHVDGHVVEAETNVSIRFSGDDAISVQFQ